ncbi:hypothetical protein COEREDRAFT_80398 [Coemansia reversa NRRL 1564]|uniref:Uncharacterized protein n=1 Tax=Coemansia reversa (strain ATCC 12441 / NRRL 1564) TaxID=763665 RepID=A0A2G5BFF9_COERN|nr:hypothetical protein COEREDRAFT_80398 [Coemansia reversa NRRL 1564]|eukprot:PIA17740.1 hypothetical protein COEREDRAFT_80398 [Coemansia reversa NRRL 1564]
MGRNSQGPIRVMRILHFFFLQTEIGLRCYLPGVTYCYNSVLCSFIPGALVGFTFFPASTQKQQTPPLNTPFVPAFYTRIPKSYWSTLPICSFTLL